MQQAIRHKIAEILSYITGNNRNITLVYLVSVLYMALNVYLVYRELYWSLLLPIFLVLLYFYFYRLNIILLFIAFLTPLAVNVTEIDFGVGISIPSEPLMFGVLVLFIIRLFYGHYLDKHIWRHPLTILILIQLFWILVTSITSQIPLVSFKFFLARLWFIVPFFLLGIPLFSNIKNAKWFIWLYVISLIGVIIYTTLNHARWGFDEDAGHWVMEPFYNDHTAYGAILTLFIPVLAGFALCPVFPRIARFFGFFAMLILAGGLILSYSRAAWISLAFSLVVLIIVLLRIKFKYIVVTTLILGIIFYLFQFEILDRLEKNKQDSSANLIEHIRSISNISTDDSNLERINRWQSAIRMFEERPVFGFGPGTYQFEYAPYQRSVEKTLISTNAGDRGNAHSEYIGPLAEQGLIGMLIMIAIVGMTIYQAMKIYRRSPFRESRVLALTIMLGLFAYFIHGIMNNFLDTDKASVPVWGFMAILVAMELYEPSGRPVTQEEAQS
jgi:O-antigen ligase